MPPFRTATKDNIVPGVTVYTKKTNEEYTTPCTIKTLTTRVKKGEIPSTLTNLNDITFTEEESGKTAKTFNITFEGVDDTFIGGLYKDGGVVVNLNYDKYESSGQITKGADEYELYTKTTGGRRKTKKARKHRRRTRRN